MVVSTRRRAAKRHDSENEYDPWTKFFFVPRTVTFLFIGA